MGKLLNLINRLRFLARQDIKVKFSAKIDRSTFLEGYNRIGEYADIRGSYLGLGSYISENSSLVRTKLGKFCSIAPGVNVRIGRHPTREFVSTHPSFFSNRKSMILKFVDHVKFEEFKNAEDNFAVVIGNDVWIGSDVTILEGVEIGDGAIIGAGAVISKDIEPYSIYIGNPAQFLRYRFTKEEIRKLEKIQWWNKSIEWLKDNAELFENISKFLLKVKE